MRGDEKAEQLALLLPGRLDTKDYVSFTSLADELAERGWLAVAFDPPGTWESGGEISDFTTTNYLQAVRELVEYFGNRPTVLIGHSRGGAVAMLLGQSLPAVIGIAMLMPSFNDPTPPDENAVQAGFKVSRRDLPPGSQKTDAQKEFALPVSYWEDGKKYHPVEVLLETMKPKLIVYATEDEFMQVEEAKEVCDKLPEPKRIYEVEAVHDYRYHPAAIKEVNGIIKEFLTSLVRKCQCEEPNCGKCLSINCQDHDCLVHTREAKARWRRNWEMASRKEFPHPKNY